jgi:hypothetical protein
MAFQNHHTHQTQLNGYNKNKGVAGVKGNLRMWLMSMIAKNKGTK